MSKNQANLLMRFLYKSSRNVTKSEAKLVARAQSIVNLIVLVLTIFVTIGMIYAGINVDKGGGFIIFVLWLCLMGGLQVLRLVGTSIVLALALYFGHN